jgi:hypothetical protein
MYRHIQTNKQINNKDHKQQVKFFFRNMAQYTYFASPNQEYKERNLLHLSSIIKSAVTQIQVPQQFTSDEQSIRFTVNYIPQGVRLPALEEGLGLQGSVIRRRSMWGREEQGEEDDNTGE